MKNLLFLFFIFSSSTLAGQSEFEKIDSILTDVYSKGEFNGIVLIGNNDSVLFSASYGYADLLKKRSIDIETQFYIASISKQFTAAAILILLENGQLELNQPVKVILQDFPYPEVTIHHLLSNTSGIVGYIDHFAGNWNKRKQANSDDVLEYLVDKKPALNFAAGTTFQYSNSNYVILAKVIEVLSKQSYPAFLEDQIFKPCSLGSTYASSKPYFTAQDGNVALGYVVEGTDFVKAELSELQYMDRVNYLSGIQGDGSVVTTINDLFLWHQALYSNLILTKQTTELLFNQTTLPDGSKSYYGYGWYTDGQIADHTGSWPGYQTRIIRNVNTGMVGISLKNVEVNSWNWIADFDAFIKR